MDPCETRNALRAHFLSVPEGSPARSGLTRRPHTPSRIRPESAPPRGRSFFDMYRRTTFFRSCVGRYGACPTQNAPSCILSPPFSFPERSKRPSALRRRSKPAVSVRLRPRRSLVSPWAAHVIRYAWRRVRYHRYSWWSLYGIPPSLLPAVYRRADSIFLIISIISPTTVPSSAHRTVATRPERYALGAHA